MAKKLRPILVVDDTAFVQLTNEAWAKIDIEDIGLVSCGNWTLDRNGRSMYAKRNFPGEKSRQICVKMHRLIVNCPDGFEVDHISGDGLDNRKSNLRIVSKSQNLRNRRANLNNKCGLKGVYFDKASGKWKAQIRVNRKNISLGRFADPRDGHAAYAAASAKFHGEFGRVA